MGTNYPGSCVEVQEMGWQIQDAGGHALVQNHAKAYEILSAPHAISELNAPAQLLDRAGILGGHG